MKAFSSQWRVLKPQYDDREGGPIRSFKDTAQSIFILDQHQTRKRFNPVPLSTSVCPSMYVMYVVNILSFAKMKLSTLELLVRRLLLKLGQIDQRTLLHYYVYREHLGFSKGIINWFLAHHSQTIVDISTKIWTYIL